jgi:hypothetical protein
MAIENLTNQSISGSYNNLTQYSASNEIFSAYGEKINKLNITASFSENAYSASFADIAAGAKSATTSEKSIYTKHVLNNFIFEKLESEIVLDTLGDDTTIFTNSNNLGTVTISKGNLSSNTLYTRIFYILSDTDLYITINSMYAPLHEIHANSNALIKFTYTLLYGLGVPFIEYTIAYK